MNWIKQIAHVCFQVRDLAAVEDFYCRILGLRKVFDFKRGEKVIGFYLEAGNGTFLEFFETDAELPSAGVLAHFCLETESLDALAARFAECDYPVDVAKTLGADHSYQLWVTDPAGVRFEFHEYTRDSTQLTGAPCLLPE